MSDITMKIAKVLNQAENAATQEEADAFLSMAQTLSTRYSIDLAVARAALAKTQKREMPERRTVSVEEFGKNTKKHMINLFSVVASNNDVKMDIAHNSTRVYPYGFPSDLDVAETLFIHIATQMVEASNKFIASGEYKNELVGRWAKRKDDWGYTEEVWVEKPVDGRVARNSFYQSYINAISRRLRAARVEAETKIFAESAGTGTELVLADKREEVQSFYKSTSKAKGSWSGASSSGNSYSASSAGATAGKNARLTSQSAVSGGRNAINA